MGLRFEAWTLPTASTFEKKFDIPALPGATGVRELSAWTDGSVPVPTSWDRFDDLIAEDDASLVRVFDTDESGDAVIVDEFIAQRCPISTTRPSVRVVSGPGINGIVEKCGVYAFADGVDDWIWGSEVNLLSNPGLEENQATPSEWELEITATGGTYTLTDGTSTTSAISFDAGASVIADEIEDDITAITDVIVTGTSISPYRRTITLVTPAFGVSLSINTGSLTGGTGTLTQTETGAETPSNWSNARSLTLPPDSSNYDAFEVTTAQARSGTKSLLIDPAEIQEVSGRNPGAQQVVTVKPGQTYQASMWVRPTAATDKFRLGFWTPGDEFIAWTSGSGATQTINTWSQLTLADFTMPAGVTQAVLRTAVTNSGVYEPGPAYYDDFVLAEGMPAATFQAILDQLLTAAQTRGTFGFLEIDALADEDTNGNALDDIAFAAWYGQDLGHVLDGGHALGYNWKIRPAEEAEAITPAGTTTHVLKLYNVGTYPTDHTTSAGGPSILAGATEEAQVVRRVPEFTAVRARGLGDLVVDDTNATALTNMGRWERIIDAENITSEAALQLLIDAAFADEDLNQTAASAKLSYSDPARPLVRFDAGDRVWWQFPGVLDKEARPVKRVAWSFGAPTTYQVQGSKVLSEDAGIAQGVDYLLRQFTRRRGATANENPSDLPTLLVGGVQGAYIHLTATADQTIAAAGTDIEWAANEIAPYSFEVASYPVESIEIPHAGYYDLHFTCKWDTFAGGGDVTITRTRNGVAEVIWPPANDPLWDATAGDRFSETAKAIPCEAGDELKVTVGHGATSETLESAVMVCELVDHFGTRRAPGPNTQVTSEPSVAADDGRIEFGSLFYDSWITVGENETWHGWVRFPDVEVPQGATITSAFIRFFFKGDTTDCTPDGTIFTKLYGVDEDDHTAPTNFSTWNTDHGIHTSAAVDWDFPCEDETTTPISANTPDISAIIQEIVDRGGWASGNAIGIHIDDDGTTAGRNQSLGSIGHEVFGARARLTVNFVPGN